MRNSCYIELTQNKKTLVDAEMYEELTKYKWLYQDGYAKRSVWNKETKKNYHVFMHRVITNCPYGFDVDHINGDKLDNRKCNLRIATRSQNNANIPKYKGKSSKYKGVCWNKRKRCWKVSIGYGGKMYHLGYFKNEEDAALKYNEHAKELFGEFAYLNNIEEVSVYE